MNIFQLKAAIVAAALVTVEKLDATYGTGPFITLITQLLQQLLPLLIGCLPTPAGGAVTAAQALAAAQALSAVQRLIMRVNIRQFLGENPTVLVSALDRQIVAMLGTCVETDFASAM